jgi:hypothetical protein
MLGILIIFLVVIADIDGILTWVSLTKVKGLKEKNKIWAWFFEIIGIVPTLFLARFFLCLLGLWIYLSFEYPWMAYLLMAMTITWVIIKNYQRFKRAKK